MDVYCKLVPHIRVAVLHSSYLEDSLFSVIVVTSPPGNRTDLSATISDDQNVLRRIGVSFVSVASTSRSRARTMMDEPEARDTGFFAETASERPLPGDIPVDLALMPLSVRAASALALLGF